MGIKGSIKKFDNSKETTVTVSKSNLSVNAKKFRLIELTPSDFSNYRNKAYNYLIE